jgi:hypothetical protein
MPAVAPSPTREDTWLITVTVDGLSLGTFDTASGGEVDSEESKYKPGGMQPEISLGGTRSIGNLTVGRYLDTLRDWPQIKWLAGRVGQGRGTIGLTPLSANGDAAGEPLVYNGTLKTVTRPDLDSTGTDAAVLELEFTCDGSVA